MCYYLYFYWLVFRTNSKFNHKGRLKVIQTIKGDCEAKFLQAINIS